MDSKLGAVNLTVCFALAVEGLVMTGTPKLSMLRQPLLPWMLLLLTSWVAMQAAAHCKTLVIVPTPFTSHTGYHTRVARALSALVHDVWLTMPTYLWEKGYVNTSAFRVLPYQTLPRVEERAVSLFLEPYFERKPQNIFEYMRVTGEIFDDLLGNENLLQNIKDKDADLIVTDNIPLFYRTAIIPYRLGKPFAFVGSVYEPIRTRIPFSTAETPHVFLPYSNKIAWKHSFILLPLPCSTRSTRPTLCPCTPPRFPTCQWICWWAGPRRGWWRRSHP